MSRIDHSGEALGLLNAGFGWADLVQMGLQAAQASFLPMPARQAAQGALRAWAKAEAFSAP